MLPTASLLFLFAFSPSLRGSHASQARQNAVADQLHLMRFHDRNDLIQAIRAKKLVKIVSTAAYELDPDIGSADPGHEELYAYALPCVKEWLDRELGTIHAITGIRFRITSLVRTEEYQRWLARHNRNAIHGSQHWKLSSHLTGATVDVSWKDLASKGVTWLRARSTELERQKRGEATMEHRNACFHIMIFPQRATARPH